MDHDLGHIGPPPQWVKIILAAKWYGCPPWELMAQEDDGFWTEAGMLMRTIDAESQERARKRA